MTAFKRVHLSLSEEEVALVDKLRDGDTLEAHALGDIAGISVGPDTSNPRSVHAVLVAGILAIQGRAEEIGYQQLAQFRENDPEHQAWRASRRSRHARPYPGDTHAV